MNRWLWRAYLAAGAVAVAAYSAVPIGVWRDAAYVSIGLSGVLAIFVGVRLHQPTRRAAWYLMAIGQLSWVVGDAVDSWYQDIAQIYEFPSPADGFYLAAYPVIGLGLIMLIRGRKTGADAASWLDSAIVTAGLALLSWVLLAQPTVTESQQSISAAVVGLAYPITDILLVGLLIRLVTTPGGRTRAFWLLLAAAALLVVGDTASQAFNLLSSSGTSDYDWLWLSSYVLWGVSALHPSMLDLSDPAPSLPVPLSRRWMAALTFATLIAPATLAVELAVDERVDGWAIVVGCVVLFSLVLARMNVFIAQIVAANRIRAGLQDSLTYQATHDSLTELPNRAQALDLIAAALYRAQRSGSIIGLLFVDVDNFKVVNDTFGHGAGDEVLRVLARRMQAEARAGDMVARLGGDEFVVLLESVDAETSVVDAANRIVTAATAPIMIGSRVLAISASIGVAVSADGRIDADRLLADADAAVYRAKSAGRGRVEIFDDALRRETSARIALEEAITAGLRDDEFVLYYQPVVRITDGTVHGYEALIRWNRPGFEIHQPAEFIPVAEASPLICELGAWVLHAATGQLARWTQAAPLGHELLTVAVNISGRHLSSVRILDDVSSALDSSGIAPAQLILEITETLLIDDPIATRHLSDLRNMGVKISIDDFGTGYTSIAQLQYLPVDSVKIDRSFLNSTHAASSQLIELMIRAAHAFDLEVIAEGVERRDQLDALALIGCEYAQGFFLSRPMAAETINANLRVLI